MKSYLRNLATALIGLLTLASVQPAYSQSTNSSAIEHADNHDGLIRINQGVHAYLKTHDVPHIWNVDGNAHNTPEGKNNFYWFTQQLFK